MANSSRLIIEYRGQRKFEIRWELGKGNLTPNVYIYILVNPRNGQTFERSYSLDEVRFDQSVGRRVGRRMRLRGSLEKLGRYFRVGLHKRDPFDAES